MYKNIWDLIELELSKNNIDGYIGRIWESARWFSFDKINETAKTIEKIMNELGLSDTRIIEYPADGKTSPGGLVMPNAWDVKDALLEIIEPKIENKVLARYKENPQSLMMFSPPTSDKGITAEIVLIDSADKEESYKALDVRNKIVFTNTDGIKLSELAFSKGAVGIISDVLSTPSPLCDFSDKLTQWHNYTIPCWQNGKKVFGFSLSPEKGKFLRSLIKEHGKVRVFAKVDTRIYKGSLPLATGLFPGKTKEEIIVTGHLCEPGANDNASGCALALEIVRALKELVNKKKLNVPKRGIRLIFSYEVRGLQYFVNNFAGNENKLRKFIAGINLDMVGNDQNTNRTICRLMQSTPFALSYTDVLLEKLFSRITSENSLFKYKEMSYCEADNLLGEPAINVPIPTVGQWPDIFYHTSFDRKENISLPTVYEIGKASGTYIYFIANAGFKEVFWLASALREKTKKKIIDFLGRQLDGGSFKNLEELENRVKHIQHKTKLGFGLLARLVKNRDLGQLKDYLSQMAKDLSLFAANELQYFKKQQKYYKKAGLIKQKDVSQKPILAKEELEARALVPKRKFLGYFSWESFDQKTKEEIEKELEISIASGVDRELRLVLFLCNGKRTLFEIWEYLKNDGYDINLGWLIKFIRILSAHSSRFVEIQH
ncbi:MAG: DUF4910 domain-containing protein [Elusimicrobia bacterium]|nr:DUF4910 domain-containing protein [Elusimicrobiota bacterium]